ncbi:MAG: membrane protein insertion efficiency factor YidD [Planctomycetota bacterium]
MRRGGRTLGSTIASIKGVGMVDKETSSTRAIGKGDSLSARAAIQMVRWYQRFLSPFLGRNCRFHPSCSQYYILSVRKYGFIRGSLKGAWRICRCNPFHPGGVDYPH